jgi:hypothetical protein
MQVLAFAALELVGASGEMVTREQLIAKRWPKGVVDFDMGGQHRYPEATSCTGR